MSYLAHHGVLGMKWGIRRYQNEDGSLKPGGKGRYDGEPIKNRVKRYQNADGSLTKRGQRKFKKAIKAYEDVTEQNKARLKTDKAESDYVKKSGLLKGNGENYKEVSKALYSSDKKYRSIWDASNANQKKTKQLVDRYVREVGKISNSRYGPLTVIGRDRTRKILEDYYEYQQRSNNSK